MGDQSTNQQSTEQTARTINLNNPCMDTAKTITITIQICEPVRNKLLLPLPESQDDIERMPVQ